MTEAVIIRNQSIDLLCKSMDWFLYDNGLSHERIKPKSKVLSRFKTQLLNYPVLHENNV